MESLEKEPRKSDESDVSYRERRLLSVPMRISTANLPLVALLDRSKI